MKRFRVIVLAVLIACLVPTSSFASDGSQRASGWELVGRDYSVEIVVGGRELTNYANSQGGDFEARIRGVISGNCYTVYLMEFDPNNNDDGPFNGSGQRVCGSQDITVRNISDERDGSDNDAEFYLRFEEAKLNDNLDVFFYD